MRKCNHGAFWIAILASLSTAGCGTVRFSGAVAADALIDPGSAYAYGRFVLDSGGSADHVMGSIGLRFECDDGSGFTAGFKVS
jgi:hypothetical protein